MWEFVCVFVCIRFESVLFHGDSGGCLCFCIWVGILFCAMMSAI